MDFARQIKKFTVKTAIAGKRVVQETGKHLLNDIVDTSPTLSGKYKANHQVGIGNKQVGVVEGVDKSGDTVKLKAKAKIDFMETGQDIIISNNLPYAGVIEEGNSDTAPRGVYKVAALNLVNNFPNIVEGVKNANS